MSDLILSIKNGKTGRVVFYQGCVGNICFYKLDSEYYARTKSSLDVKRVKNDPAFKETMRYAMLFGRGSRIASTFYRTLPRVKKNPAFYRELTGIAIRLKKEGKSDEEVLQLLG